MSHRPLQHCDDWQIEARVKNRANRLARLMALNAPTFVIVREKAMLDEAYAEWRLRHPDAPEPTTDAMEAA